MEASSENIDYNDARARLSAKLMSLQPGGQALTADDVDDDASTVFNHVPAVLIAFEKTSQIVPTPSRRSDPSIPEGLVRWRSDFEEERDRVMVEKAEAKRGRKAAKLRRINERDEAREACKPLRQRFEAAKKSNKWTEFTPAELQQMQTAGWIKQVRQDIEIAQAKPIPQKTVNFINRMAEQNERVRDQILHGIHFPGGMMADRHYGEIHEFFGVGQHRSSRNPSLARINQLLPRAASGRAQSGLTKKAVIHHRKTESSLLIRNNPYIVADPSRYGILVVELDSTWMKYNDLISALRRVLPRKLMPALIVSRQSWCGKYQVEKPHLLWVLPTEVGKNGKSREAPQRFFKRVQRAAINALIPLGADPGHMNTDKFKNPLAAFWNVLCLNGEWPSLEDFRGKGGIDLNVNEAAMKQKAALYRATKPGESLSLSNDVWNTAKDMIKACQAAAAAMEDPEYIRSRKDEHWRRCWLRQQITRPMIEKFGNDEQVLRVIDQQCDWWARHRDKADIDFGRDASRIYKDGMAAKQELTEEERQRIAAEETNRAQCNESLHTVAGVIVEAMRAGYQPTPSQVVTTCNTLNSVSKSTVYKYFDEAVLLAEQIFRDATRYIAIPNSTITNDPDLASNQQVYTVQEPVQPSGSQESGIVERSPTSFWPLPAPCGPPVSTDDRELDLDDAGAMPVTAEACSRPRTTLH